MDILQFKSELNFNYNRIVEALNYATEFNRKLSQIIQSNLQGGSNL